MIEKWLENGSTERSLIQVVFEQLTIGPLLGLYWQMVRWPMVTTRGTFITGANMIQQLDYVGPIKGCSLFLLKRKLNSLQTKVVQIVSASLVVYGNRWEMIKFRNGRLGKWLGNGSTERSLIYSVSKQLTIGLLLDLCWQMVRWPMARQDGLLLLWANMRQQLANNQPTLAQLKYLRVLFFCIK